MTILETSRELTTKERYDLTMSPAVQKMKDAVSQVIEISAWAEYEDLNSKEEYQTILAIMTPEGEVFATNSSTFREEFKKLNVTFASWGEQVHSIRVINGTSKGGREFITCVYVS